MYARLWWKDARQFWPIWVFLALAAAAVQGLLLYFLGQDVRQGWLGPFSIDMCKPLCFRDRRGGVRRRARDGYAPAARHPARRSARCLGG